VAINDHDNSTVWHDDGLSVTVVFYTVNLRPDSLRYSIVLRPLRLLVIPVK